VRGVIWLLVVQIWSWSLRLVEAAIVPRILKATGYGVVSYSGTFLSLIAMLTVFGGSEYVVRSVAADPERGARVATALLVARTVLLLPLLILVYLACRFVFHTDPRVLTLMPIFILSIYIGQIFDVLLAWRQGHSQFGVVARTQMVAQSVGLPAGIGLVYAGYGTRGAAWGGAISSVTNLIAIWVQKNNPVRLVRVAREDFVRMFREGLPFFRYRMFLWMYGDATSILYISWIAGYAANGWYTLAMKLVGVLFVVPDTIVQAILPTLTDAYERAREEYEALAQRFVHLVLVLAIPFAILLILRADALISVLRYPASFHHAATLMKLIGFGLWLRWSSVCYGALLIISNRADKRARAATLAAPYNLISTPLLVYGCARLLGNGALGAVIAAETTELIIVWVYLQNFRGTGIVRGSLSVTARGLLAGIVPALVLCLPMSSLPLFLGVGALAVLLYLPAAVLTGALPRSDLALLRRMVQSKVGR
jgi:O-antigen/teichoic acid export membrane protein